MSTQIYQICRNCKKSFPGECDGAKIGPTKYCDWDSCKGSGYSGADGRYGYHDLLQQFCKNCGKAYPENCDAAKAPTGFKPKAEGGLGKPCLIPFGPLECKGKGHPGPSDRRWGKHDILQVPTSRPPLPSPPPLPPQAP